MHQLIPIPSGLGRWVKQVSQKFSSCFLCPSPSWRVFIVRNVEVVDVTAMQCSATLEDIHTRPAHAIVQSADSSLYVSHRKEAYEVSHKRLKPEGNRFCRLIIISHCSFPHVQLFATASQDNTIKMWDVRSCRCVRTFTGHKNGSIAANVAFSPCMRYLATGSEDRTAYLFDLRMGTVLHRIRGIHGDAVMDVAWNPLHPQLATACLDGKVHFYSDDG